MKMMPDPCLGLLPHVYRGDTLYGWRPFGVVRLGRGGQTTTQGQKSARQGFFICPPNFFENCTL